MSLDLLSPPELIATLLAGEARVVPAVAAVAAEIAAAAELLAHALERGGRWVFLGAGTSGRVALSEAAEIPGTFGLDPARSIGRIAGSPGTDNWGTDNWGTDAAEDDAHAGRLAAHDLAPDDVLVALAASGRTPYTLAAAGQAHHQRASVVAVTTTPGSPLGQLADLAVEVDIGAEVLRGSTRMNAGTAQKIVLNVLSTAAMIRVGRVHGDLMIDVLPANEKLQQRSAAIVAEIAGVDMSRATQALTACNANARAAVLLLVGGLEPDAAQQLAVAHPRLRDALTELSSADPAQ